MSVNIIGKITMKYDPNKPGDNYTVYVSGSKGEDYLVYLPQCNYGTEEFVQILGATHHTSKKTGKPYYTANNVSLVTETNKNEGGNTNTNINTNTNTNSDTELIRAPIRSGLSKGEEMLLTGVFTRGVTSNKTIQELQEYAEGALSFMRQKIGGSDDPFNDQF